jgi:hypothetical protein
VSGTALARIYGIVLETDFPLSFPLPPATGEPQLRVTKEPASGAGAMSGEPLYASAETHAGRPLVSVYPTGADYLLRFPLAGDFRLATDEIRYRPLPGGDPQLGEIYLLGTVLAFWLELHGRLALHASAVAVGEGVAVFLGTNQGGKSSLAATLLQHGAALVTDDLLAVERQGDTWIGHATYPQMRLWPDQARHFYGDTAALTRVTDEVEKLRVPVGGGFGAFQGSSLPLRTIYLPRRETAGEIRITPAGSQEALVELLRCSFLARMLEACGKQPGRLPLIASLVRSVPVRQLVYPSGVQHLPEVAEAILADQMG